MSGAAQRISVLHRGISRYRRMLLSLPPLPSAPRFSVIFSSTDPVGETLKNGLRALPLLLSQCSCP